MTAAITAHSAAAAHAAATAPTAATADPGALVFDRVSKRYGGKTGAVAVNDVSFSIPRGQLVTLLGPSGCGKTTTLRLIAGLEQVSSGRILLGGRDVTLLSAVERQVSMVFQSYALFPHMTVADNVAYGLTVGPRRNADARAKALEGLALVGLDGFADRLPSELSGGQQQRVAVARALVLQPQVLLLDEPLSNLDTQLRRRVREEIRDIQQRFKLTAVYVTHDQEEALAVSDQIIVMHEARIAQQGSPRDLFETPANAFVADFICNANLLPGQVLPGELHGMGSSGLARCTIGGVQVQLPNPRRYGSGVQVAVRPDAIRLVPAAPGQVLVGRVQHASFLGTEMHYSVASPLGELFVRSPQVRVPLAVGTSVGIGFGDEGLALVGERT